MTQQLPMPETRGVAQTRLPRSGEPSVVQILKRRMQGTALPGFELVLPDGSLHHVGTRAPAFTVRLRTPASLRALAALDEPGVAMAYMEGEIDFSGDFLAALDLRAILSDRHPLHSLWRFLRPLLFGKLSSDKAWISRHYDYGNDFYFAFLDRRLRLYSQALFTSEDESLEQAAENKLAYVLRACRLAPGADVLEVGAGWGSFAGYAGARGVNVTMLTLSREQYEHLRRWSGTHGLPCTLEAVYESILAYSTPKRFDAIVLLGVMEHLPDYARVFAQFETLLKPGGRVYMDFAANRRKFEVSSFTYRYVFPGFHTPVVLPDLLAAANRTRFEPVSLHNDRHSYFLTLQHWAHNLEAAHDRLAAEFGERTYRLFRLYLWATAHQMQRDGAMESYRVVLQRAQGLPSAELGLDPP